MNAPLGKGSSDVVILLQKQQHMIQMQTQQENIKHKQIELEQKFGAFEHPFCLTSEKKVTKVPPELTVSARVNVSLI